MYLSISDIENNKETNNCRNESKHKICNVDVKCPIVLVIELLLNYLIDEQVAQPKGQQTKQSDSTHSFVDCAQAIRGDTIVFSDVSTCGFQIQVIAQTGENWDDRLHRHKETSVN